MFEYATLRIIWWLLLGILLAGFAITDGFDLGTAALLPFVAKNDLERRVVLNCIGPIWEGNQVWIILGAGAIFAAWPLVYAVSFSGFYLAILLLLLTFIIRPVAIKYRSKITHPSWRSAWDCSLSCAGFIASFILGVAVGNVLQGIPFHLDPFLRPYYDGNFFALLNPFALLCGLISTTVLLMHGSAYLTLKTENSIRIRSMKIARFTAIILIVLFALAGFWVANMKGYVLTQTFNTNAPSNPLHKHVIEQAGAWIANYFDYPWMMIAPLLGFIGSLGVIAFIAFRSGLLAMLCSGLSIFGIVTTVGLSMFPFILPSSTHPELSLLVWDASSSKMTLEIMLFATVVFLPLILAYTSWAYWVMRGKVTTQYVEKNSSSTY